MCDVSQQGSPYHQKSCFTHLSPFYEKGKPPSKPLSSPTPSTFPPVSGLHGPGLVDRLFNSRVDHPSRPLRKLLRTSRAATFLAKQHNDHLSALTLGPPSRSSVSGIRNLPPLRPTLVLVSEEDWSVSLSLRGPLDCNLSECKGSMWVRTDHWTLLEPAVEGTLPSVSTDVSRPPIPEATRRNTDNLTQREWFCRRPRNNHYKDTGSIPKTP